MTPDEFDRRSAAIIRHYERQVDQAEAAVLDAERSAERAAACLADARAAFASALGDLR